MGKNQHYIPQFYQRYWECTEANGHIWELNKNYNSIRKQAIVSRNSEFHVYEPDIDNPDDAIENWYSRFETKYSVPYKELVRKRAYLYKISNEEKRLICRIAANFSARHPINIYRNPMNNAWAERFTLGIKNKSIDRRSIQNLLAFSEGGMYEIFGGEEEILGEFEETLLLSNMQLLFSEKPNIIFCDKMIHQVSYRKEYYFPICPYIVARFSAASKYEDKMIKRITDEEYLRFTNLYYKNRIVEHIYACTDTVLKELLTR